MAVQLTTKQLDLLDKILRDEGFKGYELDIKSGSAKGENYLGIIYMVTATEKNGSKVLDFVVKTSHDNPEFRSKAPIDLVYTRELYVYNTIFPELKQFQIERCGREIFQGYPKLYDFISEPPNETLVLNNLKKKGFELYDRTKLLTEDHLAIVLKEYGKYHAISMAMKALEPKRFDKLSQDLEDVFKGADQSKFNMDLLIQKGCDTIKNSKAKEAMENVGKQVFELMMKKDQDKTNWIINHGDCWCNNLLFKYGDDLNPKKPSEVSLIDFQMTKYASPTSDVINFFYTSGNGQVYPKYETFLKIYHDSLSDTLSQFNLVAEDIYSYETLLAEFKEYSKTGIFLAIMIFHVMLTEESEVTDWNDAKEDIDIVAEFTKDIKKGDEFSKRMNDLVMFQYNNGFI